ncbi:hypothetical protein BH24DEI2_BH24DEI2_20210 [soil metagenome]
MCPVKTCRCDERESWQGSILVAARSVSPIAKQDYRRINGRLHLLDPVTRAWLPA